MADRIAEVSAFEQTVTGIRVNLGGEVLRLSADEHSLEGGHSWVLQRCLGFLFLWNQ